MSSLNYEKAARKSRLATKPVVNELVHIANTKTPNARIHKLENDVRQLQRQVRELTKLLMKSEGAL